MGETRKVGPTLLWILAAACGGDDAPEGPRDTVGSVAIAAPGGPVWLGDTSRLAAIVRSSSGEVLDRDVAWSTSDTAVVSVLARGLVRGHGVGSALVRATLEGKTDSVALTVLAPKVEGRLYALATVDGSPLEYLLSDYTVPVEGTRRRHWLVADTLRFQPDGWVLYTRRDRWSEQVPGMPEDIYEDASMGSGQFEQLDDQVMVAWNWITPAPPDAPRDSLRLRHDGLARRVRIPAPCQACGPGRLGEYLYLRRN
ncbi:MAG TPA: Ig-like domain-containing protein [Gemmatimonadales bacterium]|nr:Ig-like domain-containing protein [Gemmatimonadales bacterium]